MKTQRRNIPASLALVSFFFLVFTTFQPGSKIVVALNDLEVSNDILARASPSQQTIISCPVVGTGGDGLSRGFYVESYPGTNLGTVQMTYWTNVAGSYVIAMTARSGAYDGPTIGTTQVVTISLPAETNVTATFDFGGAPVVSGTIVTFSQTKIGGPGSVYYNTGPCGGLECTACPGIIQTEGTTPPLDTPRRASVGVTITQYQWGLYLPLVIKQK